MPPSTIPPDQVQAIIAELRASESHPDVPRESGQTASDPWRRRTFAAAGLLAVGILIGAGVGILGPGLGLFAKKPHPVAPPIAMAMTNPVRVEPLQQPVAPQPAANLRRAPPPKPIVLAAAAAPSLRPPVALDTVETVKVPPRPCLEGGACGRADVQAAERRLENAYRAAKRAGASSAKLSGVRQRWNGLKAGAADSPKVTVAGYRKLTAELYSKTAKVSAKPVRRRAAPSHEAPLPFRRAR